MLSSWQFPDHIDALKLIALYAVSSRSYFFFSDKVAKCDWLH